MLTILDNCTNEELEQFRETREFQIQRYKQTINYFKNEIESLEEGINVSKDFLDKVNLILNKRKENGN